MSQPQDHLLERGQRLTLTPLAEPEGPPLVLEVVRELAAGAHSRAWLARSPDGLVAALKTSRGGAAGRVDADLQVEERVLRQVGPHEALVRLLAAGADERDATPRPVLAFQRAYMDPLQLLSLPGVRGAFEHDPGTRWLPLPAPLAGALALDLLAALSHVHARGFVHCDVKPSHLLLRLAPPREELAEDELLAELAAGRARGLLIDAGGARSATWLRELGRGEVAPWELGLVPPQLTPLWAPPEALGVAGRARLHPSLDLYAAALTIYALLTGRAPYDHLGLASEALADVRALKAEERAGHLMPISHEALAGVRGLRRVVADLNGLLSACLQRDADRRPTVEQARQRLTALCARSPLGLAPV